LSVLSEILDRRSLKQINKTLLLYTNMWQRQFH